MESEPLAIRSGTLSLAEQLLMQKSFETKPGSYADVLCWYRNTPQSIRYPLLMQTQAVLIGALLHLRAGFYQVLMTPLSMRAEPYITSSNRSIK